MNRSFYRHLLPHLSEPYRQALQEAARWIEERYRPLGIIASGTILRGSASPSSDLDLYVVLAASYRQRVQRFFADVPTEIFANPPEAIRRYFEQEHRAGRPRTAHMLLTGQVILARSEVVEELRSEAAVWLGTPPHLSAEESNRERYALATQLEDARDLIEGDPPGARLILGQVVPGLLHHFHLSRGRFIPRDKDLLAATGALDPKMADRARAFYAAGEAAEALRLVEELADGIIGHRGFFEWESAQLPLERRALESSPPAS